MTVPWDSDFCLKNYAILAGRVRASTERARSMDRALNFLNVIISVNVRPRQANHLI